MKPFRFKKFTVEHDKSAMKIGVDGVLLGMWANVEGASHILDVGCGCGVIALICAQRNVSCDILAVDIDRNAAEEAKGNFSNSPWNGRLTSRCMNFNELDESTKYDLIISNPPYFNSGVDSLSSARTLARHQGELSPQSLLSKGIRLLSREGRIAMIIPSEQLPEIMDHARKEGLEPCRVTLVKGNHRAEIKRALVEVKKAGIPSGVPGIGETEHENDKNCFIYNILVLEVEPGVPAPEYRTLGKDFYLKF